MKYLIGYTGLVGSNLMSQTTFDEAFNSSNIKTFKSKDRSGSDLYLSCLPASKWIVNQNIQADLKNINNIIEELKNFNYNNIYLMSTIDTYCDSPMRSSESSRQIFRQDSYGSNRKLFEDLVSQKLNYNSLRIFRLAALFGKGLKKNIIYDLMNENQINKVNLYSYFQWYDLKDLYSDIKNLSKLFKNQNVFNLFPEPLSTYEIVKNLFPNHLSSVDVDPNNIKVYDFHSDLFDDRYIYGKNESLNKIKLFVDEFSNK